MNTENQGISEHAGYDCCPGNLDGLRCINFQNLKRWQVEMYKRAVEAHRRNLSMQQGRYVEPDEASEDFCDRRFHAVADEWRHRYCGSICPFSNSCLLAHRFKWSRPADADIRQTG